MLQRTPNVRLPDFLDLEQRPERKPGELTRVMSIILTQLARMRDPRNYTHIGRMAPGVPRQPRGDYMWINTGKFQDIEMRRGLNGNGKPAVYKSPVYTLMPTGRKMMKERMWRKAA